MPRNYFIILLLLLPTFLFSCRFKAADTERTENGAFSKAKSGDTPNMERIRTSGELIVGTMSGPDTYFDYQGKSLGLQYTLATDFASLEGVGVRVELSNDTLDLVKKLKRGDIDIIALPLREDVIKRWGLLAAGVFDKEKNTAWAVANGYADLADALDDWYSESVRKKAETAQRIFTQRRTAVRRSVRAPYISREKGIISTYDPYFKEAAGQTGWDWRLIAAQCYQESGFDPNAVSWAGACGLMQIMPSTAARYGLTQEKIFAPVENIRTSARIITDLLRSFSDIADKEERARFTLAAYNGGLGHVRDAQALARKDGRNPSKWADVGYYVLHLSEMRYYRDPVVHYGYMIGAETYGYVENVMLRWRSYGGDVRYLSSSPGSGISQTAAGVRNGASLPQPHKRNRFSSQKQILSPEELMKQSR